MRCLFLLVFWSVSILILTLFVPKDKLYTPSNKIISHSLELRLPKNQLGAFSYIHRDPQRNGRATYSVCFDKFAAENSRLGIFKTGLYKVIKICGLELKFYQYTSPQVGQPAISDYSDTRTVALVPVFPEDVASNVQALIGKANKLFNSKNSWRINIDIGNVSEIYVKDFDYNVFKDNALFFSIKSKRAIASYKYAEVILRGHVTIKTAEGSTLESNYVKWDMDNQHFSVNGIYVLNRNGVSTKGRNICVNTQLNKVGVENTKLMRKEKTECVVKL